MSPFQLMVDLIPIAGFNMKEFFKDDILLNSSTASVLYKEVKDLPIIDYHCHLDQDKIEADSSFNDIGELWLSGDHYKWRAMRLCGVDEFYITGKASYEEKFYKYAEILPKLIGNPLYYWTHLELKQVFGIDLPLNKDTAKEIYKKANEALKKLSVKKILHKFNVEFVATTNDPIEDLHNYDSFKDIKVTPTFRPDKLFSFNKEYLLNLAKVENKNINNLEDLKEVLRNRLDFFISKGCKISDHGFYDFPARIASEDEMEEYLSRYENLSKEEQDAFFGYMLKFLFSEYKKRNIVVQLHFSVKRNINGDMFAKVGVDSGFDVIAKEVNYDNLINLLDALKDEDRPTIILYTLNPNAIAPLACISGAYRNVYIGAAWWFNDTLNGIKRNLDLVSEYAVLGTNLGMLTDSRSFSSYSRFDFFRRILCDFVAEKVERGEYPLEDAKELVKNISYYNIKNLLKL